MEILGYVSAFFMGLVLGGLGSGGSILTVPILVYLMDIPPVTATGYSLLVVGSAAAFGAYRYYLNGMINIKSSITFAIPSIAAVYATRAFLMPAIPPILLETPFTLSKDFAIMALFAGLMVISAVMMLKNSKAIKPPRMSAHPTGLIILEGASVGVATGLLGAGGGFLIIPALVLLIGMPMKQAVASSLFIIALKSLIGFIGDLQAGITLDMPLLALFLSATFLGMFTATQFGHKVESHKLQKIFAYFILLMAFVILWKEMV